MDSFNVDLVLILLGMTILVLFFWTFIRKKSTHEYTDAVRLTEIEISRANRYGKQIVFIFIEVEKKSPVDFLKLLNEDSTIIREYDIVVSMDNKNILMIWSDASTEFERSIIQSIIKYRLTNIAGIQQVKFAIHPADGSSLQELQKNAQPI